MANIKSIGGNPIVPDQISGGATEGNYALLTAGAALGITGNGPTESAVWLQRVSTSDGPTTIRSIHGNTIVQDGALVPVNMTGVESTGFNQWDEVWELGSLDANGNNSESTATIRTKNYIPVLPNTVYYIKLPSNGPIGRLCDYDANKVHTGTDTYVPGGGDTITTPADARYMRFTLGTSYGTTYNHDICVNISDPTRNGEYEPYWSSQRLIDVATYFPDGMRSAGSIYDELTSDAAVTRVGAVDLGTLTWAAATQGDVIYFYADFSSAAAGTPLPALPASNNVTPDITCAPYQTVRNLITTSTNKSISLASSSARLYVHDDAYTDAAAFKAAMNGVILHYALATPTTTPIDPPLNMTYRTAAGGTERVMVPTGEQSAPPTLVTAQGYTAESLRDAALSAIAPVENGLASTNYGIGSYLVNGGQLCRVTTAIATGEAITIGTNVTATTVMAEVIALTQ